MIRRTLLLSLCLCVTAGAMDEDKCRPGMQLLASAGVVQHAVNRQANEEKIKKLEDVVKAWREEREFVAKYFGPDGFLAYPQSLVWMAAVSKTWRRPWEQFGSSYSFHQQFGNSAHDELFSIFSNVPVKTPSSSAEADEQTAACEAGARKVRALLWTRPGESKTQVIDDSAYPNAAEFRALAENFQKYFASSPPLERIWAYLEKYRGLQSDVHYPWGVKAGGISTAGGNPGDPRRKMQPYRPWLVGSPKARYGAEDSKRLAEIDAEIAIQEAAIAKLSGPKPPPPALGAYVPPVAVKPVLPELTANSHADLLTYREQLAKSYLDAGPLKDAGLDRHLLAGTELDQILAEVDPGKMPQPRPDGTFHPWPLQDFRKILDKYGWTAADFARHALALEPLRNDARARQELAWLISDRRQGGKLMAALRTLAASGKSPQAEPLQLPAVVAPELVHVNPYVRPQTETLTLHSAITALAFETANRGAQSRPQDTLRTLALAGETLAKPLRKGTLTRAEAIRVLSPEIERALQRTRALALDFANMESDLVEVRGKVETALSKAIARGEALTVSAKDPSAPTRASEVEDVRMEVDELRLQLASATRLLQSMAALRAGLGESRQTLLTLQDSLHAVDALHPNQLDSQALSAALKALPKAP